MPSHIAYVLNWLAPQFGVEDIGDVARHLYTAAGGAEGPFAGYLGAQPGALTREQQRIPRADEFGALSRAREAIQAADLEPGTRDWIQGALDMGLDLTREGVTGRFQRTREQQIRLESDLEVYLSAPPTQEASQWAQWLSRLILPTAMYPRPGAISYAPGRRQGYSLLPNPRFY